MNCLITQVSFCPLLIGLGLMTVSCNSSAISQPSAPVSSPASIEPLYEVNWKFCADTPNAIVNADNNGCVQNNQPLYVWGSDRAPHQIHAVLVRSSVTTRLTPQTRYKVALFSKGCFPQYTNPTEAGYYSADRSFFINKDFAENRSHIKGVEVTVKRTQKPSPLNANSTSVASFGLRCEPIRVNPGVQRP